MRRGRDSGPRPYGGRLGVPERPAGGSRDRLSRTPQRPPAQGGRPYLPGPGSGSIGSPRHQVPADPYQGGGAMKPRQRTRRPVGPGTGPFDIVGNPVPADARRLSRDGLSHIRKSFRSVKESLGEPTAEYVFAPRSTSDYWEGYWDGFTDGYWAGRYPGRHPLLVTRFFYPHYFSDPLWLGFQHPGHLPSVYHYWNWCPGWIQPSRVYYEPVDYIHLPQVSSLQSGGNYMMDQAGAQRAVASIRQAWVRSDIGGLANYLTDQTGVHVDFDGEYAYSTSAADYYAMTADMMATTRTVALTFGDPTWLSSHEVIYPGFQRFCDPDGGQQTVHLFYRLRHLDDGWYVVGVGSSLQPIQPNYTDFRCG